jgi:hypothetical protein
MDFLKNNWMGVLAWIALVIAYWMLARHLNVWAESMNQYMRQTDARLESLEAQAALWQRYENNRLADVR